MGDMGQFSVDGGDSVWVVADGDVNYRNPDPVTAKDGQLARARKMAEAKAFSIGVNPFTDVYHLVESLI